MSYRDDVREVKRLSKLIEKAEVDADAWKWERAERIAGLCETKTQREVAADVELNVGTISITTRVWREVGAVYPAKQRPKYIEAYKQVGGSSANFGQDGGRTVPQRVELAKKLIAEPAVASQVVTPTVVKQALAEPDLRTKVLKDPKTRQQVLGTAAATEPNRIPTGRVVEAKKEDLNTAAMVDLADMLKYAKRANENADYSSLTKRDRRDAESFIQATEAEIAVWRENVGGGLSDEALRQLTGGV